MYLFLQLADLPLLTDVCSWPETVINIAETHQGFNLMHRLAQTKRSDFLYLLLPKITATPAEFAAAINTEVHGGTCLWLALPDYHFIEELRGLGGDIMKLKFVNVYRVYQSHKLLLQYLLTEGLNPDDTDEYGMTAFRYACDSYLLRHASGANQARLQRELRGFIRQYASARCMFEGLFRASEVTTEARSQSKTAQS